MRSLLFVPGDRPDRFAKAAASGADALILDLEDSVTPDRKPAAREAVADYLAQPRTLPLLVRINPATLDDDLKAVLPHKPDAIMLPKAEGAESVLDAGGAAGRHHRSCPSPRKPRARFSSWAAMPSRLASVRSDLGRGRPARRHRRRNLARSRWPLHRAL